MVYTGIIFEGPSDVTYIPGLTPLPIELTCNVSGIALWRVNGTTFTLSSISNGALPGLIEFCVGGSKGKSVLYLP